MPQGSDIFDPQYAGSVTTEVGKPEKPQLKQFLKEPLPIAEAKIYGIAKPTRTIIRGKIAK